MSQVLERQQQLTKEFQSVDSWEERYKKVIALGKELPKMSESYYESQFLVKGCQSQVWLFAELKDGKMHLHADSDALIVKGLVSLLVRVYSEATPDDVLAHPPEFLSELGFQSHLSPSRANGLMSMVKQIMMYAAVLKTQLSSF